MPLLIATHLRSDLDFSGEPIDDSAAIFIRQFGFIFGRHFAIAQHINDFEPPVDIASMQQIGIQRIDAKLTFLRLRSMTLDARFFQDWPDVVTELCKFRLGRV